MLVLLRVIPFVIGLTVAGGVFVLLTFPHISIWVMLATLFLILVLLIRLVGWAPDQAHFWFLTGIPFSMLIAAFSLILFLEEDIQKGVLGIMTAFFLFFFCEHLFTYIHAPGAYQMHAIEHLTSVMSICTLFFLSASLYAFRLFLQPSLWISGLIFFFSAFFLLAASLWACKISTVRMTSYAFVGAFLLTEWFGSMTFLPSGFFPNAALVALLAYVFLGVSRAHFLQKLTPKVLTRYVLFASLLAAAVFGTARWV
jgi:hypothetical protein